MYPATWTIYIVFFISKYLSLYSQNINTCNSYSHHTWQRLDSLYNTPGTWELLGLDNTVAEDLRAVEVAAKEESIDPCTHGITIETTDKIQAEHGKGWNNIMFKSRYMSPTNGQQRLSSPAPNWDAWSRNLLHTKKDLDLTMIKVPPTKQPEQVAKPNHSCRRDKLAEISPLSSRNIW